MNVRNWERTQAQSRGSDTRLDGEENVVEDAVDRIEERRDKSAAEEKEDEEGEHAHAVVDLSDLVRQEVAEDMAAVERG